MDPLRQERSVEPRPEPSPAAQTPPPGPQPQGSPELLELSHTMASSMASSDTDPAPLNHQPHSPDAPQDDAKSEKSPVSVEQLRVALEAGATAGAAANEPTKSATHLIKPHPKDGSVPVTSDNPYYKPELRMVRTGPPDFPESEGLSEDALARFRLDFESQAIYRLARDATTKHDPLDLARTRKAEETACHQFSHTVTPEVYPVVDQLQTSRCWAFSCFNAMRIPVAQHFNITELEFSCNHIFFWNVMERTNYLEHAYVDTARRGESVDSRVVWNLTQSANVVGGNWFTFRNLVEKYGVMPKCAFPDSWSSKYSEHCRSVVATRVRTHCIQLRKMVEEKKTEMEIQQQIEDNMNEIFRIMSICTGTPPERFTWEFRDRSGALKRIGPVTPRDFYETHVKPYFDVEERVLLISDDRPGFEFGKLYTHEYTSNMVGGLPPLAVNQPMSVLKDAAAKSIKANQAVYFGAHHKRCWSWWNVGVLDLEVNNYDLLFGMPIYTMSRSERILTNDSCNEHAMILTGLHEHKGKIERWRVENCWGTKGGERGRYAMTDEWFSEYMFQIVVHKKHLSPEVLEVLNQDPVVKPSWDEGHF